MLHMGWPQFKKKVWIILSSLHCTLKSLRFNTMHQNHGQLLSPVGAAQFQHHGQHLSAERLCAFCSAGSLSSPPTAKDVGDCRQSKPSSFILCWWRERMYYYGVQNKMKQYPSILQQVHFFKLFSGSRCNKAIRASLQQRSSIHSWNNHSVNDFPEERGS